MSRQWPVIDKPSLNSLQQQHLRREIEREEVRELALILLAVAVILPAMVYVLWLLRSWWGS